MKRAVLLILFLFFAEALLAQEAGHFPRQDSLPADTVEERVPPMTVRRYRGQYIMTPLKVATPAGASSLAFLPDSLIRDTLQYEYTKIKALADRKASDDIVTDARRQAAEIVLAARQDAETERSRILAAAHAEAEDILAKAHASAEEERRSIYADAAASIADLSVSVASKIVAKTLDEDGEQRRLIERYIEEAGSLNAD